MKENCVDGPTNYSDVTPTKEAKIYLNNSRQKQSKSTHEMKTPVRKSSARKNTPSGAKELSNNGLINF